MPRANAFKQNFIELLLAVATNEGYDKPTLLKEYFFDDNYPSMDKPIKPIAAVG